jgi:steroid delta-isomerase-like uncharacterized protein
MAAIRNQIEKLTEAINRHDEDAFATLYHSDAVVMDPMVREPLRGNEAIKKDMADFITAFPDLKGHVDRVITDSDTCAMEVTMRGTHAGPLHGPDGDISPTNKPVEMHMGAFARFDEDGRIVEEHRYYDVANVLEQLRT